MIYRIMPGLTATLLAATPAFRLKNGKLMLHFHGTDLEMEHFQYDTFVLELGSKTRLTFATDADGNVNGFTVSGIEFNRAANSKPKTGGV